MAKQRLIVVGPLPPPIHGVAVSTRLMLSSRVLGERFEVEHLDTSDHRTGHNVGRWDATNIWVAVAALARLVQVARKGRRGIVYIPLSQNAPAFMRDSLFIHCAHLLGWKVACHLRGSEFRTFFQQSPRPFRLWVRATLREVDSMGVMGESLRWLFQGLIPTEQIVVVPNGTPDPGVVADGNGERVLFISNLRRRKGVREALETALLVHAARPQTQFTFAGAWEDDVLEDEIRRRADNLGDKIEFLPPVEGPTKDALLARASVFLFPPVEPEGHPRVVLEALAAGIPVVTTNRGAIAETVDDGRTGFVLADPAPDALADRVLRLLGDTEMRVRFSNEARAAFLARFTPDVADARLADWLGGLSGPCAS